MHEDLKTIGIVWLANYIPSDFQVIKSKETFLHNWISFIIERYFTSFASQSPDHQTSTDFVWTHRRGLRVPDFTWGLQGGPRKSSQSAGVQCLPG